MATLLGALESMKAKKEDVKEGLPMIAAA